MRFYKRVRVDSGGGKSTDRSVGDSKIRCQLIYAGPGPKAGLILLCAILYTPAIFAGFRRDHETCPGGRSGVRFHNGSRQREVKAASVAVAF